MRPSSQTTTAYFLYWLLAGFIPVVSAFVFALMGELIWATAFLAVTLLVSGIFLFVNRKSNIEKPLDTFIEYTTTFSSRVLTRMMLVATSIWFSYLLFNAGHVGWGTVILALGLTFCGFSAFRLITSFRKQLIELRNSK